MEILKSACAELKDFQSRSDDWRIKDWQVAVTETESLSVGIRDKEIASVYGPPTTRRLVGGTIYIVWHDGQVSRSSLNHLFFRDLKGRLKNLRRTAYTESFVIDFPEDQELPEVKIHDASVEKILGEDAGLCFEMLAQYRKHLDKAKSSFDGQVGARVTRLGVANSKGLFRSSRSTSHSFSASADSIFGIGYRSRRRLTQEDLSSRLQFLNTWLPNFHNDVTQDLSSGSMPVLLLPGATASFLGHFVLSNLNGETIANKNSSWSAEDFDQQRQVFDDKVQLRYQPTTDWLSRSYRMDMRGLMAEDTDYIVDGSLVRPIVSLKAARQLSCMPSAVPSSTGLTLETASKVELDEAVADIDRGIVVSDVLGMHTQDSSRGNYSLSIPNALLVEKGQIVGCRKATMAGNFFEDLERKAETLESAIHDYAGIRLQTTVSF